MNKDVSNTNHALVPSVKSEITTIRKDIVHIEEGEVIDAQAEDIVPQAGLFSYVSSWNDVSHEMNHVDRRMTSTETKMSREDVVAMSTTTQGVPAGTGTQKKLLSYSWLGCSPWWIVISMLIIGYLIYLDQIHRCIQLFGTTSFCF